MSTPEKIVVIGSNSFTGSHFIKHALKKGSDVIGMSRSQEPHSAFLPYRWEDFPGKFEFVSFDLNKNLDDGINVMGDFKPDYVVNMAAQSMVAQSWDHPEHWFQTNCVSTVMLHDRLRKFDFMKRYVHITTPEVYGSCSGVIDESAPMNPSTPYAVSRAAGDMSLHSFFKNYDFPYVATRAANVYGPGQQLYRIIPRTVLYARLGKKLQLHGGGHSVRSFIHIDDVCDATWKAMTQGTSGETYHISTKDFISIRDLVAKIADRMGIPFEDLVEVVDDRPGKDAAYLLGTEKIEKELGWKDEIGLDQGVDETIAWVDKYLDDLKQQPQSYIHKA